MSDCEKDKYVFDLDDYKYETEHHLMGLRRLVVTKKKPQTAVMGDSVEIYDIHAIHNLQTAYRLETEKVKKLQAELDQFKNQSILISELEKAFEEINFIIKTCLYPEVVND